jgi:hypothetical protein
MAYKVHDTVVLKRDLVAEGLKKGDLGVIVEVYDSGALEVEFVTASGKTEVLVSLEPDDLRAVEANDLVSVRPFSRSK